LNPTSRPPGSISYVLRVTDTLGCPKPSFDTVLVTILPKVQAFAGNDTTVVIGQPLLFNATGGDDYTWSPPSFLSNAFINNPIGVYNSSIDSIRYKVLVKNILGCSDSDYVKVTVFKTSPDIFVPTAFSPNGDGRNDLFRPIPVGIKRLDFFRVFNRWGQLVFASDSPFKGWDGSFGGRPQGNDTFIWVAQGTDFTGKVIYKKGSVTLTR
jgi:gliding motility-associated-like protein